MKYWTMLLIYTLSQHLDHYLDWHPDGYAVNTWSLTGRSSWSWWIVGQLYPLRVSTNSWSWMPLVNMIWTSSVFNNTFFQNVPKVLVFALSPSQAFMVNSFLTWTAAQTMWLKGSCVYLENTSDSWDIAWCIPPKIIILWK